MKMTFGKRMLSALLCFAILIGFVPAEVLSVGSSDADYLVISSDRQGNTTVLNQLLGKIEAKIGKKVLDYVALAGSMVENAATYKTSDILAEITVQSIHLTNANIGLNYAYGDQGVTDDAGIMHKASGLWKTLDNCYVYGIVENDIADPTAAKLAAEAFTVWAKSLTDQKAIVVVSYLPLHAKRGDNLGAGYWHNALNIVATGDALGGNVKRNVAFFHGHNDAVETEEYYYAPGQTMSVESYVSALGVNAQSDTMTVIYDPATGRNATATGTDATVYYTYATAGYLATNGTGTLVEISEEEIILTKYSETGAAETLGSVDRRANTVYTIGGEVDAFTDIYVTGRGLTDMDAVFYEQADLTALYGDGLYFPYGLGLSTYTPGEKLTITVHFYDYDMTDAVVYVFADLEDGQTASFVQTDCTATYVPETADLAGYTKITFTVDAAQQIIFSFGQQDIRVPEDYVLSGIVVSKQPDVTKYFVQKDHNDGSLPLNISGLTVTATYTNGQDIMSKTIYWNEFDEEKDGYALSMDMSKTGDQDVLVTYTYNGVTYTTTFPIWIGEKAFNTNGVTVDLEVPGVTGVKVTNQISAYAKMVASTVVTNFKAYNITLDSVDNAGLDGGKAHVTVPIPAGVTKPVVYYVSDDGNVLEKMVSTVNDDHTITFETSHFSIYVVGEDIEIDVPNSQTQTGNGSITTTTTKTYYVRTTTLQAGKKYLIVNSNSAGSRNALRNNNGSVASLAVTVRTGNIDGNAGNETYIDLEGVNNADSVIWAVANGYTFKNGSHYLGYTTSSGGWGQTNSTFGLSTTSRNWSYNSGNNRLSISAPNGWNNSTYYLRYNNSAWGWSTSNSSVYLYVETEVKTTTTTNVPGTYSIAPNDPQIEKLAASGVKITLGSELTFKPSNGGASTVTDTTTTATYAVYDDPATPGLDGDPADVVRISGNVVTLTGNPGRALIQVSYTTTLGLVTNYIIIDARPPYYTIDLHHRNDDNSVGAEITAPIALKNIKSGDTYAVWAVIKEYNAAHPDGFDLGDVADDRIQWVVNNEKIATIDSNGVLTFTGTEFGTITLTATYLDANGDPLCQDAITLSVSDSHYIVPGDGTNDFPEYPNEGAIRFDKTATPVGNFNQTGIVQMELSMTGVPYTTGNEIDVVIMMDYSTSMTNNGSTRLANAKEAAAAALEILVRKTGTDDEFNGNRVAIYGFNGWGNNFDDSDYKPHTEGVFEYFPNGESNSGTGNLNIDRFATMDTYDQEKFDDAIAQINSTQPGAGTNYAAALRQCYLTLEATRVEGRQQFVIFLTDGAASTGFAYKDANGNKALYYSGDGNTGLGNNGDNIIETVAQQTEYYSDLMKQTGVEIYTVGLQIELSNETDTKAAETVLQKIAGTKAGNGTQDGYTDYAITIGAADDASQVVEVFKRIAQKIMEAATNVVVEDTMGEDFIMVFEMPNVEITSLPTGQEYYLEIVEYNLDGNNKRIDPVNPPVRYYMGTNVAPGGTETYYAATAANSMNGANAYGTPVFEQKTLGPKGTKFYWTQDESLGNRDITITGADGKNYYFVSSGNGSYNMTSGAYAYGEVKDHYADGTLLDHSSHDLIIATPYFIYDARSKQLTWTLEKIGDTEWIMRYFLYLENSGGYVNDDNYPHQADPGTYDTNERATLTYDNFQGNTTQQEFPKPQVTWNGAQVSYVFYLVNDAGQPVNRAGRVVPFSEAVYVTEPVREFVYWNTTETITRLDSNLLAKDLVPDVYRLFDSSAAYNIHVYADENETKVNNHFKIEGSNPINTTYVFNTKADSTMYTAPGIYKDYAEGANALQFYGTSDAKISVTLDQSGNIISLNENYNGGETQVVFPKGEYTGAYQDAAGHLYYREKETNTAYTIVYKTANKMTEAGFNFYDTTVAFAVVWEPELKSDVVVVDFGLPVIIDVTANDALASGVVGVLEKAPMGVVINEGRFNEAKKQTLVDLFIKTADGDLQIGTATVESLSSIRFTFNPDVAMQFAEPVTFYYESAVNYYDDKGNLLSTNMYSSVTIVPATTIYYEDTFVVVESFTGTDTNGDGWFAEDELTPSDTNLWGTVGSTTSDAVQDCDRPGINNINPAYDANNIYGYDSHYQNMAQYSMGSAQKITVGSDTIGKATFTFWGTGFDVIALTSNRTGAVIVDVYQGGTATGTPVESFVVDTYYGYARAVVYATYTYANGKWNRSIERVNEAMTLPETPEAGTTVAGHEYIDGIIYDVTYTYTDGSWVRAATINTEAIVDAIELPENPADKTTVKGLEYNWYLSENDPNTIYQVPVMKVDDLAYGKYTAVITITYADIFDHANAGSYEFYLDAIRIYDPCDDASIELVERPAGTTDPVVMDPYDEDNEGWPKYQQLRDNVIAAGAFNRGNEAVNGLVFIDGDPVVGNYQMSDYVSYGPNNELYLAPGQAVAFQVAVNANVAAVHLGIKVANGNSVTYKINNTAYSISTTTDMYYDITEYAMTEDGQSLVVVIQNTGGGILSLTNLKVTYKEQPPAVSMLTYATQETVDYALIMLRGEDPYAEPDIEWPPLAIVDEPTMMEALLESVSDFFANIWHALFGWIFA